MKRLGALVFALVSASAFPAGAVGVVTRPMVYQLPFKARAGASFAKLSLIMDEAVRVSRIEIDSCDKEFVDGADFYIDFARRRVFVEGGRKTLVADLGFLDPQGESVKTVTVNFRHNSELCVKDVRLIGPNAVKVPLDLPVAEPGRIEFKTESASSDWRSSHPLNLFDGRFETNWAFVAGGESLRFEFKRPLKVIGLRVWNGDQGSGLRFGEAKPVEKLQIKSSSGVSETVEIKKVAGSQLITLKTPIEGEKFELAVEKPGRLSELRFIGPKAEFILSPEPRPEEIERTHIEAFDAKALGRVLDNELSNGQTEDRWIFRFRSNGEFYVQGRSDEARMAGTFFALGTYRIEEAKKKKKLRLKLLGTRRSTPNSPDAEPCETACGAAEPADSLGVVDVLDFENKGKGVILIRNRSPKSARGLPFSEQRVRVTSLRE